MKRYQLSSFLLCIALITIVALCDVNADVIQPTHDTRSANINTDMGYEGLGRGFYGTSTTMSMYADITSNPYGVPYGLTICYYDNATDYQDDLYSGLYACNLASGTYSVANVEDPPVPVGNDILLTWNTNLNFNPTYYYLVRFGGQNLEGGSSQYLKGSTTNISDDGCFGACGDVSQLYYNIIGVEKSLNDIVITSPVNYIGQAPQNPYFIGHYSIATTSSWNAIRIKLNQWLYSTSTAPIATHYFDTYLDYGNYQTGTSSNLYTIFGQLDNGYYNYDSEFLSKNHTTGETILEGGYSGIATWFWVGLSEGNPYAYPQASSTASTTPAELCAGIQPSSAFDVVAGIQWGLCNVAVWLFVPSNVSVDNFQNLGTTFEQKAPFAYFYSIRNALSGLTSSTTPAFVLSTSLGAFNTSIFEPIKTGLTWILWLVFGLWCIKRIAKFDF